METRETNLLRGYQAIAAYDSERVAKLRSDLDTMFAAFDEVAADRDRIAAQRDALLAAVEDCITKLVVTENNIHRELSHRGVDRWEGVPEVLAATITQARASVALVKGETP